MSAVRPSDTSGIGDASAIEDSEHACMKRVRIERKPEIIEIDCPGIDVFCKPCMHECELRDELNNVSDNLVLHEFEKWILSNDEVDENFEEVQVRVGRKPDEATEQEIEEHFARNHVPFRSWCKHCIMGRGMNSPHFAIKDKSDDSITTVSLDYAYMKKKRTVIQKLTWDCQF